MGAPTGNSEKFSLAGTIPQWQPGMDPPFLAVTATGLLSGDEPAGGEKETWPRLSEFFGHKLAIGAKNADFGIRKRLAVFQAIGKTFITAGDNCVWQAVRMSVAKIMREAEAASLPSL